MNRGIRALLVVVGSAPGGALYSAYLRSEPFPPDVVRVVPLLWLTGCGIAWMLVVAALRCDTRTLPAVDHANDPPPKDTGEARVRLVSGCRLEPRSAAARVQAGASGKMSATANVRVRRSGGLGPARGREAACTPGLNLRPSCEVPKTKSSSSASSPAARARQSEFPTTSPAIPTAIRRVQQPR
jgi:hypothetical protein